MPPGSTQPLSELPPGRRARVLLLRGGREFQHRIISMGLPVGTEVEILQGDADGGAVAIRAGETRLMLGHGMAARVLVRPL